MSIDTTNSKITILSIYVPLNSTREIYNSHCLVIKHLCSTYPDHIFLIVGQFNYPDINWSNIYHYTILQGPSSLKAKVSAETIDYEQVYQLPT